jgi:DNA-binding response OmpR family regulator
MPAFSGGTGRTVLLVESNGEQLLRVEDVLAALGYEPVGFTFSDDALRACRDEPSRFDLILIGKCPPAVSAVVIARRLRQAVPGLPILLAASSAVELSTETLLTAGISDVVHWPVNASEVAVALEQSAAGRNPPADAEKSRSLSHLRQ